VSERKYQVMCKLCVSKPVHMIIKTFFFLSFRVSYLFFLTVLYVCLYVCVYFCLFPDEPTASISVYYGVPSYSLVFV
jgi:hypothetical protein